MVGTVQDASTWVKRALLRSTHPRWFRDSAYLMLRRVPLRDGKTGYGSFDARASARGSRVSMARGGRSASWPGNAAAGRLTATVRTCALPRMPTPRAAWTGARWGRHNPLAGTRSRGWWHALLGSRARCRVQPPRAAKRRTNDDTEEPLPRMKNVDP